MFPIPGLPNPYILIGALVAIVIAWFAGDHHGYAKEHDKFRAKSKRQENWPRRRQKPSSQATKP